MFLHTFRYTAKQLFRQKDLLFWNLLFPILLSTLFSFAFSGLAADEAFHAIPVAVVLQDMDTSSGFKEVIDNLSQPEEDPLFDVRYTTKEEALSLLEKKEIVGILQESSPITLLVSSQMSNKKLEQSILDSFVSQYNTKQQALEQIAVNHPEKLEDAIALLSKEISYNTETSYCDGDMDEMITYFFNLIAMSCLFASTGGLQIAMNNQANISSLGARKCISPVPKLISYTGTLSATILHQFLCVLLALAYMIFILKINFGTQLGYVVLTGFLGSMTGVSFGFFIGSIAKFGEAIRFGISMTFIMGCSFLSGLMMQNIRIYVEKICPWFNRINPAALISDSFYSLTVYQSHERYLINSITLVTISVIFCLLGILSVRREKYAAL